MKKAMIGFLTGVLLASTTVGFAAGNLTVNDASHIKFKFNGTEKSVPAGYKVLMFEDRTYVPARFVAESIGANVDYDGATETVLITGGSNGAVNSKLASQIEAVLSGQQILNEFASYAQGIENISSGLDRRAVDLALNSLDQSLFNGIVSDFTDVKSDLPLTRQKATILVDILKKQGVDQTVQSEIIQMAGLIESMIYAEEQRIDAIKRGLTGNKNWGTDYDTAFDSYIRSRDTYVDFHYDYTYGFSNARADLLKAMSSGSTIDLNAAIKKKATASIQPASFFGAYQQQGIDSAIGGISRSN